MTVGDRTQVGAAAQIRGETVLGRENRVFPQACLGFAPQDLEYRGEPTRLTVGDRNIFREFCTVHRGTPKGGGETVIGNDGMFMAYSHVAHDCRVGDRVVFANGATLAGHVLVENDVTISAYSAVHQFCRVGKHAFIGGYSVITRDPLPWAKTVGHKPACYGLNRIGLQRQGLESGLLAVLERAIRIVTRSGLRPTEARERLLREFPEEPEIRYLVDFLESSRRGVISESPRKGRSRGGQE